jgi:hypothetical protein
MVGFRKKPTKVIPHSRATEIASDEGADTAATIGIRAAKAF